MSKVWCVGGGMTTLLVIGEPNTKKPTREGIIIWLLTNTCSDCKEGAAIPSRYTSDIWI
jgi:hypothetical protein